MISETGTCVRDAKAKEEMPKSSLAGLVVLRWAISHLERKSTYLSPSLVFLGPFGKH